MGKKKKIIESDCSKFSLPSMCLPKKVIVQYNKLNIVFKKQLGKAGSKWSRFKKAVLSHNKLYLTHPMPYGKDRLHELNTCYRGTLKYSYDIKDENDLIKSFVKYFS